MSFENKGSMVATIVVAQDGTGNYNCSGVNDQVEIGQALTHANNAGITAVHFKEGDYDVNQLTISNTIRIIGEEGVRWTLPSVHPNPSLTISAATIFEHIEFYSTVDGWKHIYNLNDATFRHCHFNFPMDSTVEAGAMTCESGTKRTLKFEFCRITGGTVSAAVWVFIGVQTDMIAILVNGLRINVNAHPTTGYAWICFAGGGSIVDRIINEGIIVESFTAGLDSSIYHTQPMANVFVLNNTVIYSATIATGGELHPCNACGYYQEINGLVAYDKVHFYAGYKVAKLNNIQLFSALDSGADRHAIDFQKGGSGPKWGSLSNFYIRNGSVTINSDWEHVEISNGEFHACRLAILDEGTGTQRETVKVTNCTWIYEGGVNYAYAVLIGYTQGVLLERLTFTNCEWDGYPTVVSVNGTSGTATTLVWDTCYVWPRIDANNPKLIVGTARNSEDHVVWIFNSEIWTENPPLEDWNVATYSTKDRFDGVTWWDTTASTAKYSENQGTAVILNGQPSVAVPHGLACIIATRFATPEFISLTGAENHVEASQVVAHTPTTTQFTLEFVGGGNVTANRDVYWRARLTR